MNMECGVDYKASERDSRKVSTSGRLNRVGAQSTIARGAGSLSLEPRQDWHDDQGSDRYGDSHSAGRGLNAIQK